MTLTAEPKLKDGRIVAIAGPVVDVEFPPDGLPEINTALQFDVELEGQKVTITAEVAQQIGDSRVRAICLKPTDGLRRGTVVRNTGRGLSMPVGEGTLGHVFNVLGEPLDTTADKLTGIEDTWEIHREPPPFDELEPREWASAPVKAPTSGSRCRSPASSRRRRSCTARWTSRRACGCASASPRSRSPSTSAT